jgi:hypothetical protein
LSAAYAKGGWNAFWKQELAFARQEERHPGTLWRTPHNRFCGAYYMAYRHVRLGDRDEAIERLEAAYADRSHRMVELDLEPAFQDLRSDRRFQDLRRRVGLPQSP